jgi:hypothetical protein
MDPLSKNKKIFQYQKDAALENSPDFLNKADEIVYSKGRHSFDDVRKKLMKTDKQKFIWQAKFDDKKLDWTVDKDPLKKSFSFFSIGLFSFSLILLISALSYAYYSFTTGGYAVKQDKIELSLEIPTLTAAGQDLNGQIIVGNTNRTIFKDSYVVLDVIEHPGDQPKIINQIPIGNVDVGNKIYKNISLNLSGLEGEEKTVNATLFYKVPQTESTFQKVASQKVLITKSPIIMSITGPQSLSINQDGEYLVSVRGISKVIPALLLTVDVPKQMKILKANFPAVGKNTYSLGPINEGDERVLKFTGSFKDAPEIGDKFTLKVRGGAGEDSEIKNYFSESTYAINLSSSPIKIEVFAEGQSGEKIAFTGKQPKVRVVVTNMSNTRVKDGDIEIKFGGGLFLPKNVSVDGAVYDSTKFTAVANGSTNEQLKEIDPGVRVEFPIEFSELAVDKTVTGRNLFINVTFTSNTEGSDGKPTTQRLATTLSPKEGTSAAISTLYFSGAFKNTGSMPAKVGEKTTYTLNMDVDTNSGFTNGKFIVPLPSYVEFIKSLDNSTTYDKSKRTVTWSVGNLSKATTTAFGISKKDTSFQVSILPNPDQARQAPLLTASPRFEATLPDKSNLVLPTPDATINISNDPRYVSGKGYESVSE